MATLRGKIRGQTIELLSSPHFAEGSLVTVEIHPVHPDSLPGAGLRRCAGILEDSWTDEDDRILAEISAARASSATREPVE